MIKLLYKKTSIRQYGKTAFLRWSWFNKYFQNLRKGRRTSLIFVKAELKLKKNLKYVQWFMYP